MKDEQEEVEECLENFCEYINCGSNVVFDYIDTSNTKLYDNVDSYLHNLMLNYEIKEITEENNTYNIKTKIAASGLGWNVSGFTVNFEIKEINDEYKITNTTLFEVIGSENVFSFTFKIFIVIGIIGVITFGIAITVLYFITKKK